MELVELRTQLGELLDSGNIQPSKASYDTPFVSDRLRSTLYAKRKKCEFNMDEFMYLGHIVGHGSVKMDPRIVQAIRDWPTAKNAGEL
ncbi:hypothetical protein CRG98_039595 [Punica granatum]|uniref:Reverse transcriptase domain-containing protein n=1 Tax=Punica granatum TaxID=22663 RepID=A0A2I0I7P4_PUNGR|nr:hypothetical protein CRG98_039595 [Punica granatum]